MLNKLLAQTLADRWIDLLQGRDQVGEKTSRFVVGMVQRDPGNGRSPLLKPL
jgi:hypothetical protein